MNKLHISKGFLFFILIALLSGCEEERTLFDGTTLFHFSSGTERVLLDWNESGDFTSSVELVSTVKLSSPQTFQVVVRQEESTALAGKHVDVPTSFTFPANTYTANFNFTVMMQAILDEFEEAGGGTLKLSLELEGEGVAVFNNILDVSLVLPYGVSMEYLVGTWAITDEGYGSGSAPVTDNYFLRVTANPDDENSVIVDGLWEVSGLPLVMHVDLENWRVMIESQHYGCYDAGLSEPACVNIYSHDYLFEEGNDPNITGIITPEGGIVLTSGYALLIEDHPTHSGYFFVPRVETSIWVKVPDSKAADLKQDLGRETLEMENL